MSCVDLAQIVAKQSYTAQSSGLGNTTIYTPASAGLFRVSGYIETTSGTANAELFLYWTDDNRLQSGGAVIDLVSVGSFGSNGSFQAITFRSAASAIYINTTFSGSGTYDVYVVLEQLW